MERPAHPEPESEQAAQSETDHRVGIASRIVASAAAHRPHLPHRARRTPVGAGVGSGSSDGPAPAAD